MVTGSGWTSPLDEGIYDEEISTMYVFAQWRLQLKVQGVELAEERHRPRCPRAGAACPPCADDLIHPSDRGVQYLPIRYTQRLAEAGIEGSVGSVGDSYDNALAETIIGLFKTEVVRRRGPWRNIDDVEFATLEWIDWFNRRRLLGSATFRRSSSSRRTIVRRSQSRWLDSRNSVSRDPGALHVK